MHFRTFGLINSTVTNVIVYIYWTHAMVTEKRLRLVIYCEYYFKVSRPCGR